MTEQFGSAAQTVGENLLWSSFGGAELIVGLIVGLLLLAFALPATHARGPKADAVQGWARSRRG